MVISRRDAIVGAVGTGTAVLLPRSLVAQSMPTPGLAPGKPHAGKELKVLCVVASQFRAHEARLANFTEQTGITAKYTYVPFANMREALTAEMVGGTGGYDLAIAMDQWVPSLANLLEPIDDRLKAKGIDLDRWPSAHVKQGNVGGKQLGIPMRGHVQLLFYRKDLFDKHGLKAPDTWEDLIETGKAIQAKEPGIAGLSLPYGKNNGQNLMVWYNFLWGRGADVFDDKGQPAFASEAGLKATQEYVDLLLKHKVTPAGAVSFTEQDAVNSMGQGNSAMLPVWWWVRSTLVNPKSSKLTEEQIGFAPLPSFKGAPRSTYTNTWIFGLTKAGKQKDAAMELLAWLADAKLEKDVLLDPKEADVVAMHWSNLKDADVNKRFGGMHNYAAAALEKTRTVPYAPEWPQIAEALETAMSEAASGGKSVADAFNGAAAAIRRIRRG